MDSRPRKMVRKALEVASSPTFGGGLLWDFPEGDSEVFLPYRNREGVYRGGILWETHQHVACTGESSASAMPVF